ncbi:AAA family ATPase [Marinobacter sp.]|uniref:AAA family ATPase n=1 Tax=Marinobacter sp. TaxID=50741 RepID=UPI0034A3E710
MTAARSAKQEARHPRTVAITGGKGGVGKTSVALNLALTLAREGQRVLLLDGDTDLANVSIMLGRYPTKTVANVINGECALEDVVMVADYGLHIVPGASGVQHCIEMDADASLALLKALSRLENRYDYIITDTAAGLQTTGMHMIAASELACVVVTPDPASLTDAFSLIKVLGRRGYKRVPSVLVNMAQGASQARSVFQRLEAAAQRHLDLPLHYLGAVWRDETLRQSVLQQRPVALMSPGDPSCRQFRILADMLTLRLGQVPPRKTGIAAYWHQVSKKAPRRRASDESVKVKKTPAESASVRSLRLVDQLGDVLAGEGDPPLLRYEAFNRLFALMGRTLDDTTIEIIQTGLGSLEWESLALEQRRHVAAHLRQLVDRVAPPVSVRELRRTPSQDRPKPYYDRVSFGEQDRLVRALREQPADISLDRLLRSLSGTGDDPS